MMNTTEVLTMQNESDGLGGARRGRGILRFLTIIFGSMVMTGCDVSRSWTEEVKLTDGSVIVIKRKMVRERFGEPGHPGRVLRQEIEYDKPGGAIRWAGDIDPYVFDFANGKSYVVAFPNTGEECKRYGNPNPPFVFFEQAGGEWRRIYAKDVPDALEFNLLRNAWKNGNQGSITLAVKRMEDSNPPNYLKKFDKNLNLPCT